MDFKDGHVKANPRVTAYRAAAYIFSKKMGLDPEVTVPAPHPSIAGVVLQIPVWYSIASQMLELALMLRSIKEANDAREAANDGTPAPKSPIIT